MGYLTEAADRSWTSQAVRVRGCSTTFASAVTAADLHKVCILETRWLTCSYQDAETFLNLVSLS